MKLMVRLLCAMLLLISFGSAARAQANIDTTNIVTQLLSLNSCSIADARRFYADKHYPLLQDTTVNAAGNTITTYRYQVSGQARLYSLATINGRMMTAGYITNLPGEYKNIITMITNIGFVLTASPKTAPNKTVYKKGTYAFVAEEQTAGALKYYVLLLTNLGLVE